MYALSMIAPMKSKMADLMKNLTYCLQESSFLMSRFLFFFFLSRHSMSFFYFLSWMKAMPLMWK
mgnify:CR=1 FL=1